MSAHEPPLHVLVTGAGGFVGRALAARLVRDRQIGGRPWGRLTLLDLASRDLPAAPGVHHLAGSIADAGLVARAFAEPVQLLVHLASVPGGTAEQQPLPAREVNLHGTLHLLDACQAQVDRGGPVPRVVFASTIAVFGSPMPPHVDDDTPLRPAMSYGAHKQMGEIAVADLTRRSGCDGLSLRLPGVLARPPARTGQLSAFLSDLMRDPAAGRDVVCPMAPTATTWACSTSNVVDQLLLAAHVPTRGLPAHRALTLPALRFSMAELVDALALVHGPQIRAHVHFRPEPRIEALFGAFPTLHTPAAEALGFAHDGDLPSLCRRAVELDGA